MHLSALVVSRDFKVNVHTHTDEITIATLSAGWKNPMNWQHRFHFRNNQRAAHSPRRGETGRQAGSCVARFRVTAYRVPLCSVLVIWTARSPGTRPTTRPENIRPSLVCIFYFCFNFSVPQRLFFL